MRISVALVGRRARISPLTTAKNGTSLSPTSTRTSPRAIARRRPRAAMRAICALFSVGNSRSVCEGAAEASGRRGSEAFTGHSSRVDAVGAPASAIISIPRTILRRISGTIGSWLCRPWPVASASGHRFAWLPHLRGVRVVAADRIRSCQALMCRRSPVITGAVVTLPEASSISPSVRDALAVIHRRALDLIVQGASLETVLDALCDSIDALDPDLISSVPSTWSVPLLSKDGNMLGTFGLYHTKANSVRADEIELVEQAGNIALLAIERHRAQAALTHALAAVRKTESELRTPVQMIPQMIPVLAPDGHAPYVQRLTLEYTGLAADEARGTDFRRRVFHPEDVERLA